jgi:hypothetical protein
VAFTTWGVCVIDEIDFARAMGNLKVLVDHITDTEVRNAFLTVIAVLDGLNVRMIEMQMEEDDD